MLKPALPSYTIYSNSLPPSIPDILWTSSSPSFASFCDTRISSNLCNSGPLTHETPEQRERLFQGLRTAQARRLANETDQERIQRLQTLRQSNSNRIHNKTNQEREYRLQTNREYDAIQFQNETDEDREHRLQQQRQNNASRIQNDTDEERRHRQEVYRQHDAVRGNDRQQELHDLQNTRDQYLSNGWRTAEQPLRQQQWVQNEMAKFHSSINSLEHRECVTCKEAWPTKQGLTLARLECLRCKRVKGNPKLYSQENDMDPGALPLELQGLTDIEEMLIARACPIMCVYGKHGGNGVTEGMF